MKIKEILELLKTDIVANIAKREDVPMSEKPLRKALKTAGFEYRNSGNKGWYYTGTGDEKAVLEQPISDFSSSRTATSKPKGGQKATVKTDSQLSVKTENKETNNPANKEINNLSGNTEIQPTKKMKKVTYEIEEQLHDELKIKSIREKRNVSEIVNEILKKGL